MHIKVCRDVLNPQKSLSIRRRPSQTCHRVVLLLLNVLVLQGEDQGGNREHVKGRWVGKGEGELSEINTGVVSRG